MKLKAAKYARRGNCYAASEALYHILGGKDAGWTPVRLRMPNDTHWFLRHASGFILDPSRLQFKGTRINYTSGRGSGFLTKGPSRRARKLIQELTWQ